MALVAADDALAETVYGSSKFIAPPRADKLVSVEYYDWAPCERTCWGGRCDCGEGCVDDPQRARTFAHVYANSFEMNSPLAPYCCCTTEECMTDRVSVMYFDQPPFRVRGRCCCCVPLADVCGPPVIFLYSPVEYWCRFWPGEAIYAAPCSCFGLKLCLCFGRPCYSSTNECLACVGASPAYQLVGGVSNGDELISTLKYAVDAYARRNELPPNQVAIFQKVHGDINDALDCCGFAKDVDARAPPAPTDDEAPAHHCFGGFLPAALQIART